MNMKLKMNLQTLTMNLKLRWTACQSTLKSARIPPFLVSRYIPFLQHLRCDSSSSSSSLDSVQQTPVVLCSLLFLQESKQYWHRTEHLIGPRGSQTRSNLNRAGLG